MQSSAYTVDSNCLMFLLLLDMAKMLCTNVPIFGRDPFMKLVTQQQSCRLAKHLLLSLSCVRSFLFVPPPRLPSVAIIDEIISSALDPTEDII
jgi:hypothetical protein